MINWKDFSIGFWVMLGVLAAIFAFSLLSGVFRKVS